MRLSGIGPDRKAGSGVELLEKAADYFVRVGVGAQSIELRQYPCERLLHLADGVLGKELTLLIETTLALEKFFPVEAGEGVACRIALRSRVGQEARYPVPRRQHMASGAIGLREDQSQRTFKHNMPALTTREPVRDPEETHH